MSASAYKIGLDVLGASSSAADDSVPMVRVQPSHMETTAIWLGALASLATLWSVLDWRRDRRTRR